LLTALPSIEIPVIDHSGLIKFNGASLDDTMFNNSTQLCAYGLIITSDVPVIDAPDVTA
jgi:hypothetical protein